ncbi:MAG: hypothetical protein KatS3mg114_0357 [Planctomycetaceae bacterium]|nr:MAG: hypothetical protein KatS3mg114_0357 [Planctomycetaceae bacterium]
MAVEALGRLQPQHAAELEAVVTLWFEDEAEDVRDAAEEALVRCGARIVGEMVVPWLQHDDADIRLRGSTVVPSVGAGMGTVLAGPTSYLG